MAAYAIDLGAVRRAHQQLERAGRPDMRRVATRLVISENQHGRNGYIVASHVQLLCMQQACPPGGAA